MTTIDDPGAQREMVELLRLIEETRKFTSGQHKLIAEASKFRIERWLGPMIAIGGFAGSLIGSAAAVGALWHSVMQ